MADTRIDYLLIGGGRTSANAAQAIRENDPDGSIAIVAGENRKPYDRPPLSKNFLEGRPPSPEDVESKGDDFFDKFNVQLWQGAFAENVDAELKLVTLADGKRFEYGKLLLATGAWPIELKIPGSDRDEVLYLRTVDDSIKIRDAAKEGKSVVAIGGGFVGVEVASTLSKLGLKSSLIARENRLWSKFLSEASGKWLQRYLSGKGIDVRLDSEAAAIEDGGVRLASGDTIPADLVVVGVGVRLNLGLARDAGLEIDEKHGIVTDASLRTSDPNIWAAGDVAAYEDVNFGKRWHLEHYMNATWQGTHVGKNMAGANEPFTKIPYFYSDLLDLHFVLRGDPQGGESAKTIGDLESGEFVELYTYDDGRLAMGIVFSHDDKKPDEVGDKLEQYLLEKRHIDQIDDSLWGSD